MEKFAFLIKIHSLFDKLTDYCPWLPKIDFLLNQLQAYYYIITRTIGLKFKLCGEIGVITKLLDPGVIIGPPQESE